MTSDTNTREHLEDSILLAYLRQQQLEDHLRLRISRHIDVEQCPRCRHKLNKLAQISATLNVLGDMQPYQRYPELSVADTYARVQGATNKRTPLHRISTGQRPRKSAVRLVSFPAAVGLTILFTMAILVFARLSGVSWIPGSFQGDIRLGPNNSTVVVAPHSTPTPTSGASTPEITPTASPGTGPYLKVCSTPTDIAQQRLVICGYNFDLAHKVTLIEFVPGKTPFSRPNVTVDKQGTFQVGWYVYNCKNLPTAIFAYEIENAKVLSAKLQNISFAACP